jgi:hypothetical protein
MVKDLKFMLQSPDITGFDGDFSQNILCILFLHRWLHGFTQMYRFYTDVFEKIDL